jgi:hypothetical protein
MDMDSMPTEELAALTEAATLVLAEIRESPPHAVSLLVQAFIMCGTAAEREACAKGVDEIVAVCEQDPKQTIGTRVLTASYREIAAAIRARK